MNNFLKRKIGIKDFPNLFLGVSLTLWFLVAATLSGITEDVVNAESITNLDKYWASIFSSWRADFGVSFFKIVTLLGDWQIVIPILLLIIYFFIKKNKREFVTPFIFTVASAELVTFVGKLLVQRLRPEGGAMVEVDFSFPSGHATIAVAFYGYLTYVWIKSLKSKLKRLIVLLVAISIIIAIGFSRLYLGVHYVSDVFAGYLVGLLALIAGISLSEWLKIFETKSNQKSKLK